MPHVLANALGCGLEFLEFAANGLPQNHQTWISAVLTRFQPDLPGVHRSWQMSWLRGPWRGDGGQFGTSAKVTSSGSHGKSSRSIAAWCSARRSGCIWVLIASRNGSAFIMSNLSLEVV